MITVEKIKELVPKQACCSGLSLARCGDVANIKFTQIDTTLSLSGVVHAEMKALIWYTVSASFNLINGVVSSFSGSPKCTCVARDNFDFNKRCCKHAAALLYGALALLRFPSCQQFPKLFQRPGMKKFASSPAETQEQVRYNLSWPDLIHQLQSPPPKKRSWSSSYDKVVTEPLLKKTRFSHSTVASLKAQLKELGLPISGKKAVLIDRLKNHRNNNDNDNDISVGDTVSSESKGSSESTDSSEDTESVSSEYSQSSLIPVDVNNVSLPFNPDDFRKISLPVDINFHGDGWFCGKVEKLFPAQILITFCNGDPSVRLKPVINEIQICYHSPQLKLAHFH